MTRKERNRFKFRKRNVHGLHYLTGLRLQEHKMLKIVLKALHSGENRQRVEDTILELLEQDSPEGWQPLKEETAEMAEDQQGAGPAQSLWLPYD